MDKLAWRTERDFLQHYVFMQQPDESNFSPERPRFLLLPCKIKCIHLWNWMKYTDEYILWKIIIKRRLVSHLSLLSHVWPIIILSRIQLWWKNGSCFSQLLILSTFTTHFGYFCSQKYLNLVSPVFLGIDDTTLQATASYRDIKARYNKNHSFAAGLFGSSFLPCEFLSLCILIFPLFFSSHLL